MLMGYGDLEALIKLTHLILLEQEQIALQPFVRGNIDRHETSQKPARLHR